MIFAAFSISLLIGFSVARILVSKKSQSGDGLLSGELYQKEHVNFSIFTTIQSVYED